MKKNTENERMGLMTRNKKFMEEFKEYKKHSNFLKDIQNKFEENGFKFKNMKDVENIILLLKDEVDDELFIEDSDSNYKGNKRTPNFNRKKP
ncbi:hypothetical protein ACH5BF_03130 [Arcobacter sp. YIC-464]|uniref:hypothetical protein n=1 Tax=Arcobacter sp. YIC-464 TaxID=3376631 RepID=UPI003C1A9999